MRWLLTYADLITVLLVFFIVMYSMSQADQEKFSVLAEALQEAFGMSGRMSGEVDVNQFDLNGFFGDLDEGSGLGDGDFELESLRSIGHRLASWAVQRDLGGEVRIVLSGRGLVVSFQEAVFFELGKADINEDSRQVLREIASFLKEIKNDVNVEGYTDDLPIQTVEFPSNWELAARRATNVGRFLIEDAGLQPHRISATSYGEHRPSYPNDTDEHRARNRRVDLVLLRAEASAGSTIEETIFPKAPSEADR